MIEYQNSKNDDPLEELLLLTEQMQEELDQKDRTIEELRVQLDESLTLNERLNSENRAGTVSYTHLLRDKLSRSDLWTKCPEVGSLRCFPCLGIPFRTVIHFSRCSSSMNYPKSTLFRPPVPYIHKVGNHLGKLAISTLSELW